MRGREGGAGNEEGSTKCNLGLGKAHPKTQRTLSGCVLEACWSAVGCLLELGLHCGSWVPNWVTGTLTGSWPCFVAVVTAA